MITKYYQRLTESIEKQYLKEAWSDSMPDWMKPRMNATAMYADKFADEKFGTHSSTQAGKSLRTRKVEKGQGYAYDVTDYAKPRNDDRVGESLYKAFKRAGIDLQKVKFIEGPIPEKKSDARIQPPNIGIWNIPSTGQVYAKGINDLEKLRPTSGTKYDDYRFEYLPIKALQELSDHFCYIDGTSIPKVDYNEKQLARNEYRKFLTARGTPTTNKDRQNAHIDPRWFDATDKSGYIVIPSARKYADKLRELHAKNWAKKISDVENRLRKARADIISVINRASMDEGDENYSVASDALNYLRNATYYYRDMLRDINGALSRYGEDSEAALTVIGNIVQDDNYSMKRVNECIRVVENNTKKLAGVELDF